MAFHNIIKFRGNFLDPNENSNGVNLTSSEIQEAFNSIDQSLKAIESQTSENQDEDEEIDSGDLEEAPQFNCSIDQADEIKKLFKSAKQMSGSEIKEKLKQSLKTNEVKILNEILSLIAGNSAKGHLIFRDETFKENEYFKKISFEKFDADIEPHLNDLNDAQRALILQCKYLYDARELNRIIGDAKSLSDAMVKRYQDHKEQLRWFKRFIKKYYPQEYSSIFRAPSAVKEEKKEKVSDNYSHYIGSYQTRKKKVAMGRSAPIDFYDFIKKTRL